MLDEKFGTTWLRCPKCATDKHAWAFWFDSKQALSKFCLECVVKEGQRVSLDRHSGNGNASSVPSKQPKRKNVSQCTSCGGVCPSGSTMCAVCLRAQHSEDYCRTCKSKLNAKHDPCKSCAYNEARKNRNAEKKRRKQERRQAKKAGSKLPKKTKPQRTAQEIYREDYLTSEHWLAKRREYWVIGVWRECYVWDNPSYPADKNGVAVRGRFDSQLVAAYNKANKGSRRYVPANYKVARTLSVRVNGKEKKFSVSAVRSVLRAAGEPVGNRGRISKEQVLRAIELVSNAD